MRHNKRKAQVGLGGGVMATMTAQPPLPVSPVSGVRVGPAGVLVEDGEGGRVFVLGMLVYAWDGGDEAGRRLAAVQLVELEVASAVEVAAGFGMSTVTLWRWRQEHAAGGVAGLVPEQRGPKGPSKLSDEVVAEIRRRHEAQESNRAIGRAVGVSEISVRRALRPAGESVPDDPGVVDAVEPVPVLPEPVPRTGERVLAWAGLLQQADPVFAPAARVPLAGLFLALPGLAASGLLGCARQVYHSLPPGFYGLDSMLAEGVLRCLVGEPRAEGATRVDVFDLGRVLGLDRAPEVKTIRRKISQLAAQGKAGQLLAAMATHHLATHQHQVEAAGVVLYVDGHVRAYQGTRKIAQTHVARLKFPAPATVETWISDSRGDPVLVVMAEPAASLAGELRRLLPMLREAVGDQRRVLVGFDRGGWSPALFAHMHTAGFDTMTWRKQPAPDIDGSLFGEVSFTDESGRVHTWQAADTRVDLPVDDHGGVFGMRQVTRLFDTKTGTRQAHLVTTRDDLPVGEVLFRMGSRWRQENYFRYARMHLALDSHDNYSVTADDPGRLVPNPAKKATLGSVNNTRARLERVKAATDKLLLDWHTPPPGQPVRLTNADYNQITANLRDAEQALDKAQHIHTGTPSRLPLAQVNPGQQILDVETKLVTHAIRIAAFNTITALARDLRVHTSYARANDEAHTLISQALKQSGDIIPDHDTLTIRLDPLHTRRATTAISQLCQHLTGTQTRYPGTNLTLRYEIKTRP